MHNPSDDQLTPEEEALFAALPRTVHHEGDLAEERLVRALRKLKHLREPSQNRNRRVMAMGLGLAASLLLFAGGVAFGRQIASREQRNAPPAIQVQRAGTALVAATVQLSDSTRVEARQILVAGLEAGTATLRAAATNLARLDPDDPVVRRIHASLEAATPPREQSLIGPDGRPVIWF